MMCKKKLELVTFILVFSLLSMPISALETPKWSNNKTYPTSPATYSPDEIYQFNVTWNNDVDMSFLDMNATFDEEYLYSCQSPYGFSSVNPCSNAVDENWNTYAAPKYISYGVIYENYTSLGNIDNGINANWTFKWGAKSTDGGTVEIRCYNWTSKSWDCLNGSVFCRYSCDYLCTQTTVEDVPDCCLNGSFVMIKTEIVYTLPEVGVYYEGELLWFINDTMLNESDEYYHTMTDLPSGSYNWRSYANSTDGSLNSTDLFSYTINKSDNPVHMYLNGNLDQNLTVAYGTQTNITGISSSGIPYLFRDGTNVSNPEITTFTNATYEYKVNSTGSRNYLINSTGITLYLIITSITPVPSLLATFPILIITLLAFALGIMRFVTELEADPKKIIEGVMGVVLMSYLLLLIAQTLVL